MKNHTGVVPSKTQFSWAAGRSSPSCRVPAAIAVQSVFMGPQYKPGVCLLPRKGFLCGLVATGLPELIRGENVAGNGQGSKFFPPLLLSLEEEARGGCPVSGAEILFLFFKQQWWVV